VRAESGMGEDPALHEETRSRRRDGASASPPRQPEPSDAGALLERLAGRPASESLSRLASDDPLKLYEQVARRIRERWFVIDPDRVFEHALPIVAVSLEHEPEGCSQPDWLTARVDRAIHLVLDADREEDRRGPLDTDGFSDPRFAVFVTTFLVEPPLALAAAVRLNGLNDRVRRVFFELMIEARPVEECLERGLGPPEQLRMDALTALWGLGHLDDDELRWMIEESRRRDKGRNPS
jgi:hypothetical protein